MPRPQCHTAFGIFLSTSLVFLLWPPQLSMWAPALPVTSALQLHYTIPHHCGWYMFFSFFCPTYVHLKFTVRKNCYLVSLFLTTYSDKQNILNYWSTGEWVYFLKYHFDLKFCSHLKDMKNWLNYEFKWGINFNSAKIYGVSMVYLLLFKSLPALVNNSKNLLI